MTRDEDMFPKGLRVLVVDDNPTCLRILERLLQNCSYEVTITAEAIIALQMLRENKDKFDIVISDVHMPNMDGFALLEHIGLELDIPVIMLSANDDPKSVMRGVKHGAVDYLLKPVRIEELKNIWQHVVRKNQQKRQKEKAVCNSEAGEVSKDGNSHTNPDETLTKKRKDQINKEGDAGEGEQEQEQEERRSDNAEILSQKKQRVVWSPELHKQFVIAVDQLGADKAFPKKILDLMNVEGLTRENVASHLQKYRLYLKRMNATLGQSGAPSLPFGIQDSSIYLNGGSLLNPFGTLCSLGGGVGKSQSAIASTQYTTGTGGMFGQFNTAASYPSNLSQRATNIGKSLLQNQGVGGSRMMDMGNFQQQNNNNNRSALIVSSSSLQNKEEFGNQTPVITVPMELRPQVVAPLADYARRLENWRSSTVALQPVQQNLSNQNQPSSIDVSQLQAALEHSFTTNASLNGGQQGLDSLGVQNVSYNIVEPQIWQPNMDGTTNISTCYNNNPMVPANGSSYQSFEDSNSAQFNNNVDPITGEVTGNNSGFMQQNIIEENDVDTLIELDDNYYLDDSEILGFTQNESESLEDIVGKLHK